MPKPYSNPQDITFVCLSPLSSLFIHKNQIISITIDRVIGRRWLPTIVSLVVYLCACVCLVSLRVSLLSTINPIRIARFTRYDRENRVFQPATSGCNLNISNKFGSHVLDKKTTHTHTQNNLQLSMVSSVSRDGDGETN